MRVFHSSFIITVFGSGHTVYLINLFLIITCLSFVFVRNSNLANSVYRYKFGPGITDPVSERAAESSFYAHIGTLSNLFRPAGAYP